MVAGVLFLMMMTKSDAAEVITAHSGDSILMKSNLSGAGLERLDVRWTHPRLVISMMRNEEICWHRRCELLRDGSLKFSRVQAEDAGNYSLQVFDRVGGGRRHKKDFLLQVIDSSSNRSHVIVSSLVCFFVLLLLFLVLLMRRRSQGMRTSGPLQENLYVVMHRYVSNQRKDKEEKKEREEGPTQENAYVVMQGYLGNRRQDMEKTDGEEVLIDPVVSMETPITHQISVDGIYV